MTQLDFLAVQEVIRLLPLYARQLDFDIVQLAYQNVLERLRLEALEKEPS